MLELRKNEYGLTEARWGPEKHDWFVLIPPGNFVMGASPGDTSPAPNEAPKHNVVINKPFWIMKYPLTQRQYMKTIGSNPSYFKGDEDFPIENVSYHDATKFAIVLSAKTGIKFRLASEAEWEYSCRAGTNSKYYWGEESCTEHAWFDENAGESVAIHPVGLKPPNPFGLHDMLGSVWEWVDDDWHPDYSGAPDNGNAWRDNPAGKLRVVRGGSWKHSSWHIRASARDRCLAETRSSFIGFRLAMDFTY